MFRVLGLALILVAAACASPTPTTVPPSLTPTPTFTPTPTPTHTPTPVPPTPTPVPTWTPEPTWTPTPVPTWTPTPTPTPTPVPPTPTFTPTPTATPTPTLTPVPTWTPTPTFTPTPTPAPTATPTPMTFPDSETIAGNLNAQYSVRWHRSTRSTDGRDFYYGSFPQGGFGLPVDNPQQVSLLLEDGLLSLVSLAASVRDDSPTNMIASMLIAVGYNDRTARDVAYGYTWGRWTGRGTTCMAPRQVLVYTNEAALDWTIFLLTSASDYWRQAPPCSFEGGN